MAMEWNEMKKYKAFNEWKTCGQPMKPFIDECGIIHITYMATAMFYQKKWLPLVQHQSLQITITVLLDHWETASEMNLR